MFSFPVPLNQAKLKGELLENRQRAGTGSLFFHLYMSLITRQTTLHICAASNFCRKRRSAGNKPSYAQSRFLEHWSEVWLIYITSTNTKKKFCLLWIHLSKYRYRIWNGRSLLFSLFLFWNDNFKNRLLNRTPFDSNWRIFWCQTSWRATLWSRPWGSQHSCCIILWSCHRWPSRIGTIHIWQRDSNFSQVSDYISCLHSCCYDCADSLLPELLIRVLTGHWSAWCLLILRSCVGTVLPTPPSSILLRNSTGTQCSKG
jgi:hypothetical protein